MNPVIRKLHEAQLRKDLPEFRAGDTVRVNVRLQEGEGEKTKERLQAFEGVVISKKGRASSRTFTVRRVTGAFFLSHQGCTLVTPSIPGLGKCFSYQAIDRSVESMLCFTSLRPWPSRG